MEERVRDALRARPREGETFDAVGVGVLRRGEAAAVEGELAEHVLGRFLRDLPVACWYDSLVFSPAALPEARIAVGEEAVEVARGEQRFVVDHLREVRHEPR